jgi:hypothetical protein
MQLTVLAVGLPVEQPVGPPLPVSHQEASWPETRRQRFQPVRARQPTRLMERKLTTPDDNNPAATGSSL